MNNKYLVLSRVISCYLVLLSANLYAATPTAAQISQFQSLPQGQQKALASQYGVNLDAISTQSSSEKKVSEPKKSTIKERKEKAVKKTVQKNGLKVFGADLFAGEPISLSPLTDLPVSNDYVLGVGDEVSVNIIGKEIRNYTLKVKRNGAITLPKLGQFHVRGLTYQQLKVELKALIKKKVIGVDISISLSNLKTMQVFVLGAAYKPGSYVLSSYSTVTQAIKAAGGLNSLASLRNIIVKRKGRVFKKIDFYDLLISGNTLSDISVKQGDVVFIPLKDSSVSIAGNVKRPAIYELKGEKNIKDVLKLAGGRTFDAQSSATIIRKGTLGKNIIPADIEKSSSVKVENGDEIFIGKITDLYQSAITWTGSVRYPGPRQWNPKLTVSDLVSTIKLDLKKTTDLYNALIIREVNVEHHIEVIHFNLLKALNNPKSKFDLALKKQDQVIILNKDTGIATKIDQASSVDSGISNNEVTSELELSTLKNKTIQQRNAQSERNALLKPIIAQLKAQATLNDPVQIIEIRGAVKFPGVYPLFVGANLKTLIALAGGLKESSLLTKAELTRVVTIDRKQVNQYSYLDLFALNQGDEKTNIKLISKDKIQVFIKNEWRENYKISLTGEVNLPGTYSFNRGETLLDLIKRAGGVTEYAYPKGAVFSRASLREMESDKLKLLHRQLREETAALAFRRQSSSNPMQSSSGDALSIVDQLGVAKAMGRMSINLDLILKNDSSQNFMLENGDALHIPPLRKVVTVIGHVQFPTSHIFDAKKTVDDYLALSGGAKKQADSDRVYVIKANGSVSIPTNSYWFPSKNEPLSPGDTIVMPIDSDYVDSLTVLTSATQILYQLGVAWSAIK